MPRVTSELFLASRKRGLTFAQIARITGYSHGTIRNLASGSNTTPRARAAVEKLLGVRIWKPER